MARPTSYQPNRRAYQKALPDRGAPLPKPGTIPDGPTRTAAWPDPGYTGNSSKRLRGVRRVKTSMMERT